MDYKGSKMIVGLCGKKQSGKSTVARFLGEQGFVELSWAYPLKEIVGRQLFGLNDDQLYGSEEAKEAIIPDWGYSARQILQLVGTECFRKVIRDDFWVVLGRRRLAELSQKGTNIVISDCRFPNEMEAIKSLGGFTIRVVREGQISTDTHPSENSLNDYVTDFTITAKSGDIKTLERVIGNIVLFKSGKVFNAD